MITPTIDARKQRILKACGSEPRTMDELAWAVIKTIESTKTDQYNGQNLCKVVGFAWAMGHGTVRNTHSAPMNGEQNWSASDPNIPTGYPGWNGRVWIRYKDRNTSGSSEAFRSTLTPVPVVAVVTTVFGNRYARNGGTDINFLLKRILIQKSTAIVGIIASTSRIGHCCSPRFKNNKFSIS